MRYTVVAAGAACAGPVIATTTVAASDGALPGSVQPPDAGALHPVFDAFFTLPPGSYHVCATPLAGELVSQLCQRAEGDATVVAQATTEILLVSQCPGNPNGGLDVITTLNDPPVIDKLDIAPSKFISTCDKATLTVTASDPNGDALTFTWEIVSGPAGATLTATGASATMSATMTGDYSIRVTVTDVYRASAALTFPLHVSMAGNCGDKRVFVTAQPYAPSFGSAAAGDAICQGLANSNRLGGTWMAWLSSSVTSPAARFSKTAARYVRLDGAVVAMGWADLTTRSNLVPINVNEIGGTTNTFVWTGTNTDGTRVGENCVDWTRGTTMLNGDGLVGASNNTGFSWTVRATRSCFLQPFSLYCFEQ